MLHDAIWFLGLLPLFDALPCLVVLMFDAVRFTCAPAHLRHKSKKSFRSADVETISSSEEGAYTSKFSRHMGDTATRETDDYGTFDGDLVHTRSPHRSFGPGSSKRLIDGRNTLGNQDEFQA